MMDKPFKFCICPSIVSHSMYIIHCTIKMMNNVRREVNVERKEHDKLGREKS